MTQGEVLGVFRETVWVIMKLGAPMLLISVGIGLVVAVFQAATQIHEQTITFVPKVIVIAMLMLGLGSWMLTTLSDLFHYLMTYMAGL